MGIIDSKNLLTATENIKPKATKPYSKRRKNPFAKQFKLTDRNAPKDASASESLTGILNAKPANKTVLTDNRQQGKKPVLTDRKASENKKSVLTDNRSQNKKPVLTDNKSSEKKSISADGRSLFLQTTSRIITITSRNRESRSTLLSLRRTKRKAAERRP